MLEINLQTSYELDKNKETKQNTHVYLLFGAMGHHVLAERSTSLSLSLGNGGAMAQWENEWLIGGCGWLERQRVSRHRRVA